MSPQSRAHTLLSWDSEIRLLRHLGLEHATLLLDLGCGPGYVAAQILSRFPSIRIIGLDTDHGLLRFAAQETADSSSRRAVVQGRAEACPLAAGAVDFVLARFLFQHLPDPLAAAREAHRVLAPGGRLVVVDVDDDMWGLTDPPLVPPPAANAAAAIRRPHHGRFIGRHLWRILCDAGFDDVQLDAFVYHSDTLGMAPFADRLDERVTSAPDAFVMFAGLMAAGVRR